MQNRALNFQVNVRSQNKWGQSDSVYILIETVIEPIMQIAEAKIKEEDSDDNQILKIIKGVFVKVMLTVIMATLAMITFLLRMRLN